MNNFKYAKGIKWIKSQRNQMIPTIGSYVAGYNQALKDVQLVLKIANSYTPTSTHAILLKVIKGFGDLND